MDALFEVPGAAWVAVSPALTEVRRIAIAAAAAAVVLVLAAARLVVGDVFGWSAFVVALVLLVGVAAVAWVGAARNTASWAWAERESDLFVRHGVLVRRLEVVPYGRMQLVEVTAGPLQRRAGIATVTPRRARMRAYSACRGRRRLGCATGSPPVVRRRRPACERARSGRDGTDPADPVPPRAPADAPSARRHLRARVDRLDHQPGKRQ
jgi:membrane protein YdbS with pleckstrin-like domain